MLLNDNNRYTEIFMVAMIIIVGGVFYYLNYTDNDVHTLEKAKSICEFKGMSLPSAPDQVPDYKDSSTNESRIGYWAKDGRVFHNKEQGVTANDEQEHYVICKDRLFTF